MADCGVCIGTGYDCCDGSPEICETRWPRARKEHRCGECGATVRKGEEYQRISGKYDGEFFDEKTCIDCAEVRDAFTCEAPPIFGQLWADMKEFVFPALTTSCFDKMQTPRGKQFLREEWMKWKGLRK